MKKAGWTYASHIGYQQDTYYEEQHPLYHALDHQRPLADTVPLRASLADLHIADRSPAFHVLEEDARLRCRRNGLFRDFYLCPA